MNRRILIPLLVLGIAFPLAAPAFAADTSSPQLLDWTLVDTSKDISNGDATAVVRFILSDESEISTPNLLMKSLSTTQMTRFATVKEISRSGKLVSYEASTVINFGQSSGYWEWVLYPLKDKIGNSNSNFGPGGSWNSKVVILDSKFTNYEYAQVRKCLAYVPRHNQNINRYLLLKSLDPNNELLAVLNLKYNFPSSIIDSGLCTSDAEQILKIVITDDLSEFVDRISEEIDAKKVDKAAADKAAADKAAADKAALLKKTTITCIKGKLTKKVTAIKPVCPAGYKKK